MQSVESSGSARDGLAPSCSLGMPRDRDGNKGRRVNPSGTGQLSPCPAAGWDEAPLPCAAPPARLCDCGAIRGLKPHNLTTGTALPMPGCSSPPPLSPGEPFARPCLGSEENGADLPPRRGRGLGATGWHCCLAQTPSSSGAGGKTGKRWRGQSPGVALGPSHQGRAVCQRWKSSWEGSPGGNGAGASARARSLRDGGKPISPGFG